MGWRERFGADDERARIAARARALLDAAGARPSPGGAVWSDTEAHGAAPVSPVPPPRGGWVPQAPAGVPPPALPSPARHAAVEPLPLSTGPIGAPERVPWRERARFDPRPAGLLALAAVVVVVGSVAGGVMFHGGRSSAVTVAAASGAAPPSAASTAPTESTGAPPASASGTPAGPTSPRGDVTVDVAGSVAHPGVYTLPAGSRVEDALRAAGGARPGADLSTLNRARVLVDGEQVAVGVTGAPAPAVGTGPSPAVGGAAGTVDLNTATLADLDTLPGVGPVLAQKILDWRTEHGRFGSVDDLQQVSGIGPTRFADLKDLVTV